MENAYDLREDLCAKQLMCPLHTKGLTLDALACLGVATPRVVIRGGCWHSCKDDQEENIGKIALGTHCAGDVDVEYSLQSGTLRIGSTIAWCKALATKHCTLRHARTDILTATHIRE